MKELKKLADEIVARLVDCESADPEPVEQYKEWTRNKIAEAFRALEQRALAAEAKLAELERQPPVGKQYRVSAKGNNSATGWSLWHDGDGDQYKNSYDVEAREVFTRPAPAADLAELVPDECPEGITDKMEEAAGISLDEEDCQDLWGVCRAAILRNIEEKK